jgi:hypothetical protein
MGFLYQATNTDCWKKAVVWQDTYNRLLPPTFFCQTYRQLGQLQLSMFDTLWSPYAKPKEIHHYAMLPS